MRRHPALALFAAFLLVALLPLAPLRAAPQLRILAAESVYGQVAAAIAGPQADVVSVLSKPSQDPHDFEATASAARDAADAAIVIVNGAGYDSWMDHLLAASPAPGRAVISAATLMQAGPGANPHLWYNPATMPRVAQALAACLARRDPAAATSVQQRLAAFLAADAVLQTRVKTLRARFAGTPVTATEPLFGYMASALGLNMLDAHFQLATMNGTEPRASDVAAMESDLRAHRVRALIYNTQVVNPATLRLRNIAREAGVPLVGMAETLPPGATYITWMVSQLNDLEHALAAPS
jgi:zinc/manganese transport system substrate-binding protein